MDQNTQPQKVETNIKTDKKIPPPQPIIVDDVKNYHAFYDIIKASVSEESFITKLMNQNKISINVNSGDAYRNVVKTLTEGSFIFHTYESNKKGQSELWQGTYIIHVAQNKLKKNYHQNNLK